jgi:hypothetical protein
MDAAGAARSLVQRIVVGPQAIRITAFGEAPGAPSQSLDRHASITLERSGQPVGLISASTTESPRIPDLNVPALGSTEKGLEPAQGRPQNLPRETAHRPERLIWQPKAKGPALLRAL